MTGFTGTSEGWGIQIGVWVMKIQLQQKYAVLDRKDEQEANKPLS